MFKTLILTSLLAFSTSVNALNDENNVNISNSDCDSVSSVPINREIEYINPNNYVRTFVGTYNYKDRIYLSDEDIWMFGDPGQFVGTHTIYPQYPTYFYCSDLTNPSIVPSYFVFAFSYGDGDGYCAISYVWHSFADSSVSGQVDESYIYLGGTDLANLDYRDVIFSFPEPLILTGFEALLFETLFTTADNQFVVSYDGYYTMNSTSVSSNFVIVGNLMYQQRLYLGFFKYGDNWRYLYYDSENDNYGYLLITPNSQGNGQYYFNNVKMPVSSRLALSNVGVFAFVRDTSYDNATFRDMLFSVMDSPLYFLSSLFNWELFGTNLF